MTESIVVTRLTRNVRYKLTYIRIFEDFLGQTSNEDAVELFQGILQAQQTALSGLAAYMRQHLGISAHDLELNDKLLDQAAGRRDLRSQLQFTLDGLERAAAWYRMQLVDRQMTSDPALRALLLELGELESAKQWRTEAVMGILKVPTKTKTKEIDAEAMPEPPRVEEWKPRLVDDLGRPSWTAERQPRWSPSPKPRRRGRQNR